MLSSIPRHVLSTTTIRLSLRTLVAPTLSNISKTPRFLACQPTTQAISFSSPVMLVVFSHPFQSSTRPKLCSTSFLVILQRWLVPKMELPSLKPPSHPASLSRSWPYTQCDMLRCWLIKLSNTRPMLGC